MMRRKEKISVLIKMENNDGIKLNNVSFYYPINKDHILKNINLEIMPNETIVIVGENGAGTVSAFGRYRGYKCFRQYRWTWWRN